ncbi:MAG: tRNA glutamyl-Q(34) synthetase GluQRS [Pseudomonadota bacterium]
MNASMIVERFAPSPTGLLHIGHAYSAWRCFRSARDAGGRFLLRMEDLDASRVREAYYAAIESDLHWLELDWDGPVLRQSHRHEAYSEIIEYLWSLGVLYRCSCTRRDIQEAISAPQEGANTDTRIYPGTCRNKKTAFESEGALRLDLQAAIDRLGGAARLEMMKIRSASDSCAVLPETVDVALLQKTVGDVVIVRRDGVPAYHLTVVIDDAFQGVTHVTRGADLAEASHIQRVLQALLNYPDPVYRHHRLVRDETGKRLAKRDDARAIASYRDAGLSPGDVFRMIDVNDPAG